jgi:hypothetical protein
MAHAYKRAKEVILFDPFTPTRVPVVVPRGSKQHSKGLGQRASVRMGIIQLLDICDR